MYNSTATIKEKLNIEEISSSLIFLALTNAVEKPLCTNTFENVIKTERIAIKPKSEGNNNLASNICNKNWIPVTLYRSKAFHIKPRKARPLFITIFIYIYTCFYFVQNILTISK